jgi:hypothetical protein
MSTSLSPRSASAPTLAAHGLTPFDLALIHEWAQDGGYWQTAEQFVRGVLAATAPADLTFRQRQWLRTIQADLRDRRP